MPTQKHRPKTPPPPDPADVAAFEDAIKRSLQVKKPASGWPKPSTSKAKPKRSK